MPDETTQCGCCAGIEQETPVRIVNRPGLSAIVYRVGTHASFKDSMLAAISTSGLSSLRSRLDDDFSIALIDSWAATLDILTFYQERIANECYLRTATEPVSVAELADLIGYAPRPGLAAGVDLAFILEDVPAAAVTPGTKTPAVSLARSINGVPGTITIDAGTAVQSVPGPGETPQTFETIQAITAKPDWNGLRPFLSVPYSASNAGTNQLRVPGLASGLQAGDAVLLIDATTRTLNRVKRITLDLSANSTIADLEDGSSPLAATGALTPGATPPDGTALSDPTISELVLGKSWNQIDLEALAAKQSWDLDELGAGIKQLLSSRQPALQAFTMGIKAALFGHNAPIWGSLPAAVQSAYPSWPNNPTWEEDEGVPSGAVDLDNVYSGILKQNWFAMFDTQSSAAPLVLKSTGVQEFSRTGFSFTARITRVLADYGPTLPTFPLRTTKVLAQSAILAVGALPVTTDIAGSDVLLDRAVFGLRIGQKLAVTGERSDKQGVRATEVATISAIALEDGLTRVSLLQGLRHPYLRGSVTINANVAPATMGATRQEILGSGDASQPFQSFTLKQPPLTWISSDSPTLSASTLTIRVNGVEWREVDSFYGSGPQDRVYAIRTDENAQTAVMFGDGITGARLPSGGNNVQATYRQGIGKGGMVKAGALSMLLSRPLGLKAVTNPLDASGGEDRESVPQARENAPFTVRTLGRIVSLKDYEDFVRASAGITKALAGLQWDGHQRVVMMTVSGPDGAPIDPESQLYSNLLSSIAKSGDPSVPVLLAAYRTVAFQVGATIQICPNLVPEEVLAAVKTSLRARFSFEARAFSQPVFLSEVVAAMQDVPGVVSLNLTQLCRSGDAPSSSPPDILVAKGAVADPGNPMGAELLLIDAGPLPGIEVAP